MASAEANYSGSSGGSFVLHIDVTEISVDTPNNRSLVNVTEYMYKSGGSSAFNSGTTYGNIVVAGNTVGTSVGAWGGSGGPWYLISNYQQWVTHNSDGTGSVYVSAYHDAADGPYVTTASTALTLTLTTINRYSNITSFTVTNITDEGFTLNASVDQTASTINFSIDGGGSYSGGGSGTSASQVYHGLLSGHTYTCYAHSVNSGSGLSAYSGSLTATTTIQNNFFEIRIP